MWGQEREPGGGAAGEGDEDVVGGGDHGVGGDGKLELPKEERSEASNARPVIDLLPHPALGADLVAATAAVAIAVDGEIQRGLSLSLIAGIVLL